MLNATTSVFSPPENFIAQFETDDAKLKATQLWVMLMIALVVIAGLVIVIGLIYQPTLTTAGGSLAMVRKLAQRLWPW